MRETNTDRIFIFIFRSLLHWWLEYMYLICLQLSNEGALWNTVIHVFNEKSAEYLICNGNLYLFEYQLVFI